MEVIIEVLAVINILMTFYAVIVAYWEGQRSWLCGSMSEKGSRIPRTKQNCADPAQNTFS